MTTNEEYRNGRAAGAMSNVTINEIRAVLSPFQGGSFEDTARILSFASHELKNPVSAIIALAEILADQSSDRLDPCGRKLLADLLEAGERTLRLIDNLLDISLARANADSTPPAPFSVLAAAEDF